MIPGPGTMTILNATARKGRSFGMSAVFGTLTGDFVYMLSAILGLEAVLRAYPAVLTAARWIGILYLIRTGWNLLRSQTNNQMDEKEISRERWLYFRQALSVSLTNPKVIMFFMAFFPIFLGPESKPATLFIMMIHVTAISLIYQTFLVIAGNGATKYLSRWKHSRIIAIRMSGLAMIGFGIRLAADTR